ncbi:hypothetical protein [Hymenobacter sp. GOD-10R]|nr:hypothetical protein [Hymenobacter sp. GOD-10R]WRQ30744.1 hypothetical protein SD425_10770 [Hymenobacter sp. GOD-10R]
MQKYLREEALGGSGVIGKIRPSVDGAGNDPPYGPSIRPVAS